MKEKKLCKSRTEKSPRWHLKKMMDGHEQQLRHGHEVFNDDSEIMQQLYSIYLALNQAHLDELKRERGVVS